MGIMGLGALRLNQNLFVVVVFLYFGWLAARGLARGAGWLAARRLARGAGWLAARMLARGEGAVVAAFVEGGAKRDRGGRLQLALPL